MKSLLFLLSMKSDMLARIDSSSLYYTVDSRLLVLGLAVSALLCCFVYFREHRISWPMRSGLMFFRFLALASVLFVLTFPVLIVQGKNSLGKIETIEVSIWDTPLALIVILVCYLIEWFLRKLNFLD